MIRPALAIAIVCFPSIARGDEQDEAIAHVINLKGTLTRDAKKPDKPVVRVSFSGLTGKDLELKKLAAFPELRSLDLQNTRINDSQIADLKHLKSLVELDLSGTVPTGFSFAALADSKIEQLNLYASDIADPDVKELAKMKSLKWVSLGANPKLTGQSVAHAAAIPRIETLYLTGLAITDDSLKALSGAKTLKTLNLSYTKLTDAGMKHLAGVANLAELYLADIPVSEEGLKHLAPLKLAKLEFGGQQIIDDDLQSLAAWPNLEYLEIRGASITNGCMKHIGSLKKLRELRLNNITRLGDGAMKDIASLPELRVLMVYGTKITKTGLAELAAAKNLEFLTLPDSPTDAIVAALGKAGKLHTLDCCYKLNVPRFDNRPKNLEEVEGIDLHRAEKLTAEGLKHFAGCKKLKTVMFVKCGLTDPALKELAALPELGEISVYQMNLTDEGLKSLVAMKKLKRLYHYECKFTEAGLNELKKALPDLKVN